MAKKAPGKATAKAAKAGTRKTKKKRSAPAKARTTRRTLSGTATPRGPSSPPPATSGTEQIFVRMYRGLLGDFFFVRHTVGDRTFKMLIDCGVLQCIGKPENKPSTARGKARIIANVKDFLAEFGKKLDLVVTTHEHYDHLSGFLFAKDDFKDLEVGRVWMAWTEDRSDKLANGYRDKKNKALTALAALADNDALAAAGHGEIEAVRNLLQFYGDIESIRAGAMGLAKPSADGKLTGMSCEAVLEWLRQRAGPEKVSFLKPGEVVKWGVDDAFRAYVLGPPRDDKLLRKLDPSPGEKSEVYLARSDSVETENGDRLRAYVLAPSDSNLRGKTDAPPARKNEVYLARGEDVETVKGLAALHGSDAGEVRSEDRPFTRLHARDYNGKNGTPKRRARPLKADPIVRLYETKHPEVDRSIDSDWLGSAENLALKIDGDVNNTSLALALELADKRVLLFPGDAQVGNWLSWANQTYPADDNKDGPRLKIEELLARTILYKVGHHASHNATLQDRGLELMSNRSLCAMIPVVADTAHEQKTKKTPKGWAMPYDKLYKRLGELTAGRVVRGDGDAKSEPATFKQSVFEVKYGPDAAASDPLWVELKLKR